MEAVSELFLFRLLLTFIDRTDVNRTLQMKANQYKFEIDAKKFREYFGIAYTDNLGNVFKQFYSHFNDFVPQVLSTFGKNTPTSMFCFAKHKWWDELPLHHFYLKQV